MRSQPGALRFVPTGLQPRPPVGAAMSCLPLLTLYLTERCNSRCTTCDYWRQGARDITLESINRLLPELRTLRTGVVLISGGEPLIHPQWAPIAQLLRDSGLKLWLLTSGLSLAKHARRACQLFDSITVSLDGTDRDSYAKVRGLDAFDQVCAGVRAVADRGTAVGVRVTLQRANYKQLVRFVELAASLGACRVSFLGVDVANPQAFGRREAFASGLALEPADLPGLAAQIDRLEQDHGADFLSGFIAESPAKLRRIQQYFAALCGQGPFPAVRCNAPEFSAVLDAHNQLRPCFFIAGPALETPAPPPTAAAQGTLLRSLNGAAMQDLRAQIREGKRPECITCVCSMWRDPERTASEPAAI